LALDNKESEFNVYKLEIKEQIRKLPCPFATTNAKGRFICIHCFILEKRDVLIVPDRKFIKCTNCSNQVKIPAWYRSYVNNF